LNTDPTSNITDDRQRISGPARRSKCLTSCEEGEAEFHRSTAFQNGCLFRVARRFV